MRRGAPQGGLAERKAMIDRPHALPVARQCQLLKVARSTAYDQTAALALMRRIDELHLQYPFAGARMLRDVLRREGHEVGRRHGATLMRRMGITRPNHVWAADSTDMPMRRGFGSLCAILDWASRRVLAWRLSNTLTTDFCLEAVREALAPMARRRCSTPIKGASSRARNSPAS